MKSRASLMLIVTLALFGCNTSRAGEIEIGAAGPDFSAVGADGETYNLASMADAKVVVLCFTCKGCPVAQAYEQRLVEFAEQYGAKGVQLVALNCNNRTEDLEVIKQHAKDAGFNFTYAFDESGDAARAYGALVTPHLFVLDANRKVAYRGAFDDSQNDPKEFYVAAAVDALLAGRTPETSSTKAVGCGIKLQDVARN